VYPPEPNVASYFLARMLTATGSRDVAALT
jgi:hypothetical protein